MGESLKKISLEGKILLALSFIDCAGTALSIQFGLAKELNPVMNLLLRKGLVTFVFGKITISAALISALEILRCIRPRKVEFIRSLQGVTIVSYPALIVLANLIYYHW